MAPRPIPRVHRPCETCNTPFEVEVWWASRRKYCSRTCAGIARRRRVQLTCAVCGNAFEVAQSTAAGKDNPRCCCSRKCKDTWMGQHYSGPNNWRYSRVERVCEVCETRFTVRGGIKDGHGRFCSMACQGIWRSENTSGDRASNWQGGKSFEPYPATFNARFRRLIRARDGHRCGLCGKPDSRAVHHINYVKMDTHPENCITLCNSCHSKTNHRRAQWQALCTEIMILRSWRAVALSADQ